MYELILYFLILFYLTFIFISFIGLFRLKSNLSNTQPFVSVVIPARNEEKYIQPLLESLIIQNYPKDKYEVIIINDRSTDKTGEIIDIFSKKNSIIKAFHIQSINPRLSPKKNALNFAINNSRGEIILATDGDCRVSKNWISGMVRHFTPEVGTVAGFSQLDSINDNENFWIKLQSFELLSLFTCAAGTTSLGWYLASSGSNHGFRRILFDEIGGYDSIGHLVSGDDDLLLQKIARTKWKAVFSTDPDTFINTEPMRSFKNFYFQRKRWGSKYQYHRKSYMFFLTLIYLFDLFFLFGILTSPFSPHHFRNLLYILILKMAGEFILLLKGTAIFKRKDLLKYFPFWSLLHIPYIVIFGPLSIIGKIVWKGEKFATRSRWHETLRQKSRIQ